MTVVTTVLILLTVALTVTAAVAVVTLLSLRALTRRFDAAVREAVVAALAEDREREMVEARAFWAEQEARAAEDAFEGESVFDSENLVLLPAPRGYVDDEGDMDPEFADALRSVLEEMISEGTGAAGHPAPAAPAAPAAPGTPPAHPSVVGFIPQPTPTPEWTDLRLNELVDVGVLLRDVRPGPMGTLDVYVFEDETTLCIAPGDPAAGAKLRAAVDGGTEVRLLGNSRLSGAHALTFALGSDEETVYILADRVVASL
ncbi:hypothetical protein ACEZCY_28400 [Streptacidiphilus sp. N1-12]|uniref:Uncharacterized protein n=2 Tax=Streptacidiphilus alkalitolerans TaxID=3342712 RepID=A0ABV6VGT7_9ACTN